MTEAFTWIGTALGLGVAVGASVAGKIVDHGDGLVFLSFQLSNERSQPCSQ